MVGLWVFHQRPQLGEECRHVGGVASIHTYGTWWFLHICAQPWALVSVLEQCVYKCTFASQDSSVHPCSLPSRAPDSVSLSFSVSLACSLSLAQSSGHISLVSFMQACVSIKRGCSLITTTPTKEAIGTMHGCTKPRIILHCFTKHNAPTKPAHVSYVCVWTGFSSIQAQIWMQFYNKVLKTYSCII